MSIALRHIGKYELYQRLASRKLNETWKAFDTQARRYVKINIFYTTFPADSEQIAQFRQQAEKVAALHRPDIERIYDTLVFPSKRVDSPVASMVCLISEYIEGSTLADYIHHTQSIGKSRPGSDCVQFFTTLSQAIDDAHGQGIMHGNIQPANIVLRGSNSQSGQLEEPVLTDFDFIKLLRDHSIANNSLYLSPEQIKGQPATKRSDTYSLSVILYELCTGVLPFRGNRPVAIMMQHLTTPPTPPALLNPTIPASLTQVIMRGLTKEPERRFASASSLTIALARSLSLPIPEELNRPAFLRDALQSPDDGDTLQPGRQTGTLPATSGVTSSHWTTSRKGVQFDTMPSREANNRQRKRLPGPRYTIALIILLLATLSTIGAALLFSQNKPPGAADQLVGHAFFLNSGQINADTAQGINDELQIDLSGIPDPPAGKSYFAWLLVDRSVSESLPVLLGTLRIDQGNVHFLYHGDGQHSNLLATTSRFLVTLDDTQHPTSNPLLDTSTWRYYAEIPSIPSPTDALHFSMLNHLRHLLVESPELQIRGLHGGLAFWLARNISTISASANDARDAWHNQDTKTIHTRLVQILDLLDGVLFARSDLPPGTPLLADAHSVQIPLLGPAPNAPDPPGYAYSGEVPPGYVYLISEHMSGAIQSPQTTPDQKQLAIKINTGLDSVKSLLAQIHQDAIALLKMDNSQLLQPASLSQLDNLAIEAQIAYTGQLSPSTGQSESGALWIYGNLQRLAAFDVRPYLQ
ncbi:MAG TPA: serine/threonine-protein kinase [Ktedonobacteraceae bacterium]|nr:serine/threonine-protein kinase [Ktedonobacteraceae bacterium]